MEKKWGQEDTGVLAQSVMQHFYRTQDKLIFKYIDLGKSSVPYPSELS